MFINYDSRVVVTGNVPIFDSWFTIVERLAPGGGGKWFNFLLTETFFSFEYHLLGHQRIVKRDLSIDGKLCKINIS